MRLQERLPGDLRLAPWGGLETASAEDVTDRRRGNDVPQILEGTLQTVVTPARVVRRHLDNQRGHITANLRSTRRATAGRHGLADQLPMPGEDGLRRHDGRDLSQQL